VGPTQGLKCLFTFLFNTVSAKNELKCHFRKQNKFRCQNRKKMFLGPKRKAKFKVVSNKEFSLKITSIKELFLHSHETFTKQRVGRLNL
jgi:hypothetical protein